LVADAQESAQGAAEVASRANGSAQRANEEAQAAASSAKKAQAIASVAEGRAATATLNFERLKASTHSTMSRAQASWFSGTNCDGTGLGDERTGRSARATGARKINGHA